MVGYTSVAEVVERYLGGLDDIIFEYKGRELMLGRSRNEKGEFVRAMQEHIGDDWPNLMLAPKGDDEWLLRNFKIDGLNVYELIPLSDVTGM